jgi:hypothetical protein
MYIPGGAYGGPPKAALYQGSAHSGAPERVAAEKPGAEGLPLFTIRRCEMLNVPLAVWNSGGNGYASRSASLAQDG